MKQDDSSESSKRTEIKLSELPFVSVVIVNFNGRKWLTRFFKSVVDSDYPHNKLEIILVDNGSTDGSVQYIKDKFGEDSRIKVTRIEENVGWARAVNKGMRISKGEIMVHISSDVEVAPNWLREITKVLTSNPKIGIVQCNSFSVWDRKSRDSVMNFLDKYGFSYGYVPEEKPREVFLAEGLAFAVKRKVIKEIGIFHEYFFMEYDDMDICWRARLGGYKVYFIPSAVVYHVRGGTIGRTYFQRLLNVKLYTRNHLITLIKNYEWVNVLKTLPVVMTIDFAKIAYLIARRKSEVALMVLKGILSTLTVMKPTLRERWKIQHIVRKVSDRQIMKCMVPFNPHFLKSFLVEQEKGKRFAFNTRPPIEAD